MPTGLLVDLGLLRPSAISGLIRLRRELSANSELPPADICRLLSATYANAGIDVDGALALHGVVPVLPPDVAGVYRLVISTLIETKAPPWLPLFRRGREAVVTSLDLDARLCFERAGALDESPGDSVLQWLDELVSLAFAQEDADRLAKGRAAERLSFEREKSRLASFDKAPSVQWVSLDNNMAGYDVLSYVVVDEVFVPQQIEVKSSAREPPTIHLTRHEWDVASSLGGTYIFHVWHVPTCRLRVYSVADVAMHIPIARGAGRWESIEIDLPEGA